MFHVLVVLYVVAWLIRGMLTSINLLFGTGFLRGESSLWSRVTFLGLVGVGVVCGLVWLAGEVVAGYREPEEQS